MALSCANIRIADKKTVVIPWKKKKHRKIRLKVVPSCSHNATSTCIKGDHKVTVERLNTKIKINNSADDAKTKIEETQKGESQDKNEPSGWVGENKFDVLCKVEGLEDKIVEESKTDDDSECF